MERDEFVKSISLPDADAVDEYHIEEELEVADEADAQLVGEECRAEDEPAGEEDEEGGVVARELQLRRLPVREVAVHLPWRRQLQIEIKSVKYEENEGTVPIAFIATTGAHV